MSSNSNIQVRILIETPIAWLVAVLLSVCLMADAKGQQAPITAISITPSGDLLAGSDDGLQLHDSRSLKSIKRIETGIEKIYSIKISPDRTRFAVSGGTPAELGVVEVFSFQTFKKTHQFGRFDDVATDCVWISNDRIVACSMTGNCCLMPLNGDATVPFNVHSKGILGITLLKSGKLLTAGLDNTIGVWELGNHREIRVLNNHVDIVNQIASRPPSSENAKAMIVSVSDDATARFWQPEIGRMVRFARLEVIPTCVVWNRTGTRAIVGTRSGQIFFVDPQTATIVQSATAIGWVNCLALTPDETSIIVGGESGLQRVNFIAR